MALCKYGVLLLDNNEDDAYIRRVWDIVTFDLEWVMDNWDTEGRDTCKITSCFVQGGWSGCRTGNGEKLSNSQLCCLAQLCLAAA